METYDGVKKTIIFAIIFIISAVLIFGQQIFPAVKASGGSFSFKDFYRDRDGLAANRDLTSEADLTVKAVSDLDLEKGVINSFVEDSLISSELQRRGKNQSDIEKLISDNIKPENLGKIEEATKKLYGWSVDDFKKFILYPQARRQILEVEFNKSPHLPAGYSGRWGDKDKIDFDAWLGRAKKKAMVSIYLPRWRWVSGEVEGRY